MKGGKYLHVRVVSLGDINISYKVCVYFFTTGCENAKVYVWEIPEDGLTETLTEPQSYLMGKFTKKKKKKKKQP